MVKWTEDVTYKFVQEYLKYQCLYNCNYPKYGNKSARKAALLRISETMNIPGFGSREAYSKIRNLKSTYSQEVKKIKESMLVGTDVYIPRVKWFRLINDAFNNTNVKCGDPQNYTELDSQHVIDGEETCTSQYKHYADKNNSDLKMEYQNITNEDQRLYPITRKRKLRKLNRLVCKVTNTSDTNTSETETEFDIFGRSVAAQLNNMPIQQAIQAQMFIQNYLCNLRLQQMGLGSSHYVQCPSPNPINQLSCSPNHL